MADKEVKIERNTNETSIVLTLDMSGREGSVLSFPVPFFEHMLSSMAFHGGFRLEVKAAGDIEVDPHHLVEDIGIVFGNALLDLYKKDQAIARYGHAVIPMDDALSEVTVDICGRAYLQFLAEFPQKSPGGFDISLVREFLQALANNANINVHAKCRYGINTHHMVESLFKALGIALKQAFRPESEGVTSTKGVL